MTSPVRTDSPALLRPVVLFDLDGTLVDTVGLIVDSYAHVFERFGITGIEEAEVRSWIGLALEETFEALDPVRAPAMAEAYRAFNVGHHDERIAPYPGADAHVGTLLDAGADVGVVTSKGSELARRGLTATSMPALDVVIGKEHTLAHKPDPAPLRHALEVLGARAEDAVYVGDAATDLQAAHAAGMAAVGVTWGAGTRPALEAQDPLAVVDSFAELTGLLAPER
ncbi:HAD-IA family hydrolase [Brachybacterium halotolerans subsp. kimchii]|uniref:HAD-IA family hydrolase n=1 Tax=Brachybacterium halotolerans TaxID=2795215 RepID=UPI001E40C25A|nr:HAD-IA family hydrolase [Brachybacterium halotolerans]UEJ83770.1 HAD-IA family hydrolase [Brachybacterium halotolerans subsp. kimchii]